MKKIYIPLLLMLLMLLSGCSSNNNSTSVIITDTEPIVTPAPAAYSASAEPDPDSDGMAENYTPENMDYYNGNVMPAPVTVLDTDKDDTTDTETYDAEYTDEEGTETATETTKTPLKPGDITLGVVVTADAGVNPLSCEYRDLINVNSLVYESLVELDANMQPQPLLANRWQVDNDIWTFVLRSDIVFHDGSTLTAYDVVASYEEILNHPASRWYSYVSQLEGMKALDDVTLEVKSKDGMGYFTLYCMTFPVVSQASVLDDTPSGTGPYWYVEFSPNNGLRIESNPQWWRKASGGVESLTAVFYTSTSQAMQALETGEIDTLSTESATASLSRYLSDRMTIEFPTSTYECIIPNMSRQILSSEAVRQAIMYAIDRTTIAETIYGGMAQESEVPVQPGTWLYDPQSTQYNYSPERALKALYDDGWSDPDGDNVLEKEMNGSIVELELTLSTYNRDVSTTRTDAAEAIAEQLAKVGFKITVEEFDTSDTLSNLRNGKFDLALVAFELSELPNLSFMLASSGNCNYSRYEEAAMDVLLKQAYETTDQETLKTAMSRIQLMLVEDLPILGLFYRTGLVVSKQSIGGITGSRQGNVLRGLATSTRY